MRGNYDGAFIAKPTYKCLNDNGIRNYFTKFKYTNRNIMVHSVIPTLLSQFVFLVLTCKDWILITWLGVVITINLTFNRRSNKIFSKFISITIISSQL
jgi:hypothetical protein